MARRAPKPPSPSQEAFARIGDLISKGATPDRVGREAERVAAEWAAEGDDGLERIAEVREQFAEGLAAAEEHAGDVDQSEPAAVVAARNTVAALRAAHQAFSGTGG